MTQTAIDIRATKEAAPAHSRQADTPGPHPHKEVPPIMTAPAIARPRQSKNKTPGRPIAHDKLTVAEVCAELDIAPSTFYGWRTKGTAPRCIKLPNGQIRVRRAALETWLNAREDAA